MNSSLIFLVAVSLLLLVGCAPSDETIEKIARERYDSAENEVIDQPTEEFSCLDNLDRFAGTYSLSVVSRQLGITDYTDGEEICGTGNDFFGDLPTNAIISVAGNAGTLSVNINNEWYAGSGPFEGPTAPKKPLVGGGFYETSNPSPAVNSCGTESPYFSFSKKLAEDGGQTSLTLWVYAQEDAINIVGEAFWLADDSEILSPCHGVIIFQGTK